MKKFLLVTALFLITIVVSPSFASAGTEHNLTGWAWSSNIGWISFNCTNRNMCDLYVPGPGTHSVYPHYVDADLNWRISGSELSTAITLMNTGQITTAEYNTILAMFNYREGGVRTGEYHVILNGSNFGVNLNADNTLTGYAWSPAIGWIQFGDLSGFPNGNGTQAQNANINGNNLKGWAKAIAADGNGWDGWISLSGALQGGPGNYSVDLDGTSFEGYAWGGSVVGWISFDVAGANGVTIANPADFTVTGPGSLDIQFIAQNGADSEIGSYFVDNGGSSYSLPVTMSMDPITPSLPAGTTILYSFDSGQNYGASPSTVISNYAQGLGLRVRLNRSLGATEYTIHLKGVGSDGKTRIRDIKLAPVSFSPAFEEF